MAFNAQLVKSYAQGAVVAFAAPLASYNGSAIALSGAVAGTFTSTPGLVIAAGSSAVNIEWESLYAIVQTGLTTSTIVATPVWQGSNDGTNWITLVGQTGAAMTSFAAAGTGSLVTTTWAVPFPGNPSFPYIRLAILNTVVTGAAGDNVKVSYNWRRRAFVSP